MDKNNTYKGKFLNVNYSNCETQYIINILNT